MAAVVSTINKKIDMKRLKLLSAAILICTFSYGQTVKIQTGVSISNLDRQVGSLDWKHENKSLVGIPISIGLDYFQKMHFCLSSNLGLLKKGGTVTLKAPQQIITPGITIGDEYVSDQKTFANIDYLSFNTTCDFSYPLKNNITPFISLGPRIDLLLDNVDIYNKYSYGLLLGGGLKYNIKKLQVGLRFDYYLNLNDIYKTEQYGTLRDKTFTTNLIIGYRLK
jgi:hypothetical protein